MLLQFLKNKDASLNEANYYTHDEIRRDGLFHFTNSPAALANILDSNRIYSKKINRQDESQFDLYLQQIEEKNGVDYSFVCFTTDAYKVPKEFDVPFGIEFNYDNLRKKYLFNPYSQIANKTNIVGAKWKSTADKSTGDKKLIMYPQGNPKYTGFNDARIVAMGTLASFKGKPRNFIILDSWNLRIVPDDDIYDKLLDIYKNQNKDILVHFINNASNRNNSSLQSHLDPEWMGSALTNFKSIANLEKFQQLSEIWCAAVIPAFGFATVGANSVHNYRVKPISFIDSNTQLDSHEVGDLKLEGTMPIDLQNYIQDKIFQEYEVRAYIPQRKDLVFNDRDIITVLLPEFYLRSRKGADRFVRLKKIFMDFQQKVESGESNPDLVKICLVHGLINRSIIHELLSLFQVIFDKHLKVDFFDYDEDPEAENSSSGAYAMKNNTLKDIDIYDRLEKDAGKRNIGKRILRRYKISNDISLNSIYRYPEAEVVQDKKGLELLAEIESGKQLYILKDSNGNPSLLCRNFVVPADNDFNVKYGTRIGCEAIIVGSDENDVAYIKLVQKSRDFFELPGGSFDKKPNNDQDVKEFASRKVRRETGMNIPASDFTVLPEGIYLREGNSELGKSYEQDLINGFDKNKSKKDLTPQLGWTLSYYALVATTLKHGVTSENIEYYASGDDPCRWMKVETLKHSENFRLRYKNIIGDIEYLAKTIAATTDGIFSQQIDYSKHKNP